MRKYSSTTKGSSRRIFRNKELVTITVFGVCVLAVLFLAPRVFGVLGSVAIMPIVEVKSWIAESSGTIPTYLRDRGHIALQIRELRQALGEHAGAHLTVAALKEENEALRDMLSATTSARVAAAVIDRPTNLPYDVFLIDRGTNDGIQREAPVYVSGDRVIGFVAETYADTSLVVLVTSPDLESTVYVYGSNIYTTALGMGGGSLRISVPQGIALNEGDPVVIPSLDGGVYGVISVVDSEPSRPEQYGYVSIDTPLAGIRYVTVGNTPFRMLTFDEAKEVVESLRADILSVPVPQGILIDTENGTSTATTTESIEPPV